MTLLYHQTPHNCIDLSQGVLTKQVKFRPQPCAKINAVFKRKYLREFSESCQGRFLFKENKQW